MISLTLASRPAKVLSILLSICWPADCCTVCNWEIKLFLSIDNFLMFPENHSVSFSNKWFRSFSQQFIVNFKKFLMNSMYPLFFLNSYYRLVVDSFQITHSRQVVRNACLNTVHTYICLQGNNTTFFRSVKHIQQQLTVSTSCMFALLMCDSYCDQLANQKSEIILLMSLNTQKALSWRMCGPWSLCLECWLFLYVWYVRIHKKQ